MKNDFKKCVGERIQKIRKLKGISQEKLAEKVGISPNTVSYWERGKNAITFNKIPLIADALGVPVYKLFIFNDFDSDADGLYKLLETATPEERKLLHTIISNILLFK